MRPYLRNALAPRFENGPSTAHLIKQLAGKTRQNARERLAVHRIEAKNWLDGADLPPAVKYARCVEFLKVKEDEFLPHAVLGYLMLFNSHSLEEAGLQASLGDARGHILRALELVQKPDEQDKARYLLGIYALKVGLTKDEGRDPSAIASYESSAEILRQLSGNPDNFAAACADIDVKDPDRAPVPIDVNALKARTREIRPASTQKTFEFAWSELGQMSQQELKNLDPILRSIFFIETPAVNKARQLSGEETMRRRRLAIEIALSYLQKGMNVNSNIFLKNHYDLFKMLLRKSRAFPDSWRSPIIWAKAIYKYMMGM